MPSFDVVSEIDMQEVRNAVDQTSREVTNRFDFKDTNSTIELNDKDMTITLESASRDRLIAFRQVLEEKMVKRKISLKSLDFGDMEDAAGGRARMRVSLKAGISSDMAKKINGHIKDMKLKGIQSQTQGDQVRVSGKKRDALQEVIAGLKEADFDLPLQFENFRD
ncbi:MAG: YajQ family cyclic di-GMP-binding protein [Acidimicrobiia bacterium]|nr:YajQ family cyclic di-GMP-binding protein [Acidimicrobiia bacterium]MDH3426318.1 YajQ family cyclic di-GMP-binding protein [Acidimicrobiia bacterium]